MEVIIYKVNGKKTKAFEKFYCLTLWGVYIRLRQLQRPLLGIGQRTRIKQKSLTSSGQVRRAYASHSGGPVCFVAFPQGDKYLEELFD